MGKVPIILDKNQLIIYQEKYKSDINIANHLNVTRQYIHQLRKKYGLNPVRVRDIVSERNKLIQSAFSRGAKRKELVSSDFVIQCIGKSRLCYSSVCRIVHGAKREVEINNEHIKRRDISSENDIHDS